MQSRSLFNAMNINLTQVKYQNLAPFYFREFKKDYLLTNDVGDWLFLTKKEFDNFLSGGFEKGGDSRSKLKEKNFLKRELNLNQLSEKYHLRNEYVFAGPTLHIVIPTLRCNQKCVYCHASAQDPSKKEFDMNVDTARKTIERIFEAPIDEIIIEFQGGEPLLNWPIVKFIIRYSQEKARMKKKKVWHKLVSNFSLMDDKKFRYLLNNKVGLAISLDGPEKLHNKQRILLGGNSYKNSVKWIKKFYKIYPKLLKRNYIFRISGLVTITRFSLPYYKEIIDEYLKLGFMDVYIRPMDPFGFSQKIWKKLGYSAKEFLDFYKKLLSYVIELNLAGKKFREKTTLVFLRKILTDEDPFHTEYRSPCGAVIGQIAYNHNGDIYTCDEGRMLGMMGDESFRLGNIFESSYNEIIESPITKTVCLASCLEGLPGCSDCVYKPYCGVCPIYNYFWCGNLFSQMPNNDRCKINRGILDFLFENLKNEKTRLLFENWVRKDFFPELKKN